MPEQEYKAAEISSFGGYLKHAWNVFRNKDPIYQDVSPRSNDPDRQFYPGSISYRNPDKRRLSPYTDKTLVGAIYNRIATDAAMVNIKHVRTDSNGTFKEEINSGLNQILTIEANKDQTAKAFIQDLVMSMLDEGVAAAVPVDTSINPNDRNSFDILSMRVGRITQWEPDVVQIEVYNDRSGRRELIKMRKSAVAIVENPFYHIMNEPNSVLKRLERKIALMDGIDDDIGKKKLDVIIQLPYVVKNKTKQEQADERRRQLEDQLERSKLGVGYIDGTERVIQLNRSLENNLLSEVEYLTSTLYSQLGMTPEILNGSAPETVMMNYYRRIIDVILQAICDEFKRKFLSKTARTQHQTIQFYRQPFIFTSSSALAEIADKFTRNEILAPNEVRGIVGFLPSSDEAANELRNRNISQSADSVGSYATIDENGGEATEPVDEDKPNSLVETYMNLTQ